MPRDLNCIRSFVCRRHNNPRPCSTRRCKKVSDISQYGGSTWLRKMQMCVCCACVCGFFFHVYFRSTCCPSPFWKSQKQMPKPRRKKKKKGKISLCPNGVTLQFWNRKAFSHKAQLLLVGDFTAVECKEHVLGRCIFKLSAPTYLVVVLKSAPVLRCHL